MTAYYNEHEPYAAAWLRNLIKAGLIPDGEVDTRSIVDVRPDDLRGFTQCHFFAGIGGWSHALRLAGWPDDRAVWTGSCPCQPFSVTGKGLGADDPRHLWPHFFRLIAARRPAVVMGEQVAGAAGYSWLDGVRADLAREGYASRGVDIPACAVDAPHIRQRLYWVASSVADAASIGRQQVARSVHGDVEEQAGQQQDRNILAASNGEGHMADAEQHSSRCKTSSTCDAPQKSNRPTNQHSGCGGPSSFWSDAVWLTGADGKARRAQPSIPLLAHGIPARVGRLRAYGNAIVPQVAAEVIGAFIEARP